MRELTHVGRVHMAIEHMVDTGSERRWGGGQLALFTGLGACCKKMLQYPLSTVQTIFLRYKFMQLIFKIVKADHYCTFACILHA